MEKEINNESRLAFITRVIEDYCSQTKEEFLPSLRSFSNRYKVSLGTVAYAAKTLKNKKVLSFSRGSKISINANNTEVKKPVTTLHSKSRSGDLYEFLSGEIEKGSFRIGKQLPQLKYFAHDRNLALQTIRKSYEMLEKRGAIHREGKSWIVGPAQNRVQAEWKNEILVLRRNLDDWFKISESLEFRDFAQAFDREAVNFKTVLYTLTATPTSGALAESGKTEVLAKIRKLGNRYLGTLIVGNFENRDELASWINLLESFKRPIVFLEQEQNTILDGIKSPKLTKFSISSKAASDAIVKICQTNGHRFAACFADKESDQNHFWNRVLTNVYNVDGIKAIQFPETDNLLDQFERPWLRKKIEALAKKEPLFNKLISILIEREGSKSVEHIELLERCIRSKAGKFHSDLFALTPLMFWLLYKSDSKIIIAPSGNKARLCYHWLKIAGVKIPEEISLLAYGNGWMSSLPVSTIRIGLDNLGYKAFHRIAGTMQITTQKQSITAEMEYVRRGSVSSLSFA
ncbi:MAG: GntR family transcriptional regulator [Fibrobacteres bacterium]|nr:GntR family transcriptional regulator [Fibrobacterota bacterium]